MPSCAPRYVSEAALRAPRGRCSDRRAPPTPHAPAPKTHGQAAGSCKPRRIARNCGRRDARAAAIMGQRSGSSILPQVLQVQVGRSYEPPQKARATHSVRLAQEREPCGQEACKQASKKAARRAARTLPLPSPAAASAPARRRAARPPRHRAALPLVTGGTRALCCGTRPYRPLTPGGRQGYWVTTPVCFWRGGKGRRVEGQRGSIGRGGWGVTNSGTDRVRMRGTTRAGRGWRRG